MAWRFHRHTWGQWQFVMKPHDSDTIIGQVRQCETCGRAQKRRL